MVWDNGVVPSIASGMKTRAQLIAAAQDLLSEGKSDFTIAQVAAHAGLSVGSVYTHFADREKLIIEASRAAYADVAQNWMGIIMKTLPDQAPLGVLAISVNVAESSLRNSRVAHLVLSTGLINWARSVDRQTDLVAIFAQAAAAGQIKCDDPEALVTNMSAAYQFVIAHYLVRTHSPDLAARSMWLFAKEMGYSREQFDNAVHLIAQAMQN